MKNLLMLNLQLFANTVQTTLLSGLSAEMKTYYDMNLITRLLQILYTTSSDRSVLSRRAAERL